MADNALNTNENLLAGQTPAAASPDAALDGLSNLVGQGSTSNLLAAADKQKTEATGAAAPVAEQGDLDLSGLEDTVNSFTSTKEKEKKIDFSVKDANPARTKAMEDAVFERTFFNKLTRAVMLTLVFILVAFVGYTFQQYLRFVEGKSVSSVIDFYMPSIHKGFISVNKLIGQNPDKYGIDSLTTSNAQTALTTIATDDGLNYIAKKEVLNRAVDQLVKSTITQYTKLDEIKQDIGSYGFFPKDVQQFAASTFIDNSLQKSLLAVEAIRFSTALTFFSNLDTFIQQFSSFISLSSNQVTTILDLYRSRGEKDIQNYLTTCYFNPYVNADSCSMPQGNDFANYYTYVDTNARIDARVFPILMNYLDAKLEDSDFPSLEININSFDPLENNISFGIDLNTFQEDEIQMLNRGILNPHIYLATKIINLLRESKFVVAEPINLSTLKVNKKKLRIGNQEYTVNNSAFNFTLPLQKNAQREIYDFDQRQE